MTDIYYNLASGERVQVWLTPKVNGRERVFAVYEFILQGQDGNQGTEYKRLETFDYVEEAFEFMKEKEQNKPNGWYNYKIIVE